MACKNCGPNGCSTRAVTYMPANLKMAKSASQMAAERLRQLMEDNDVLRTQNGQNAGQLHVDKQLYSQLSQQQPSTGEQRGDSADPHAGRGSAS